ncbi:MAG: hypothetical protein V2A74_00495 [bacterium]
MSKKVLVLAVLQICFAHCIAIAQEGQVAAAAPSLDYVVLGWNDLGNQFMMPDYSKMCILPPYNTLRAQAVKRGNPPQLVTSGVTLTYRFPSNTTSANKINFWTYEQALFNTTHAANIGLTGNGLSGTMTLSGTSFVATSVPITPYEDAAPTTAKYYQTTEVTLAESQAPGVILDQTLFIAPISDELGCGAVGCHYVAGVSPWQRIIEQHNSKFGTSLTFPTLCARCHADSFIGKAGGSAPVFSRAIHNRHRSYVAANNCTACHPGTNTQSERGAMAGSATCVDCHGNLTAMASSTRTPWVSLPRCGQCHDADHAENTGVLYRNSVGHSGLYCSACHNSPHAELPSAQPLEGMQMERLQGSPLHLTKCSVCHLSPPLAPGPHNVITAYLIAQHKLGTVTLAGANLTRADYNSDGQVNIGDVIRQVNRDLAGN